MLQTAPNLLSIIMYIAVCLIMVISHDHCTISLVRAWESLGMSLDNYVMVGVKNTCILFNNVRMGDFFAEQDFLK